MQSPRALPRDLDVIDVRLVADLELEHRVHLVLVRRRAEVAFDQHRTRALLNRDERTHEHRCGLAVRRHEHEVERTGERGARGDVDHRAVAHERRVERDRDVVARRHLAETGGEPRIAGRQHLRRRADAQPRLEVAEIGELGYESAVDEHDAARIDRDERGQDLAGARLRRRVGRACERLGVAHERAQVGIFPILHPPVRQAFGLEALERVLAQRGDRRRARKRGLGGGEARRQRGLGCGLDRSDLGVHRSL